MEFYDWVNNTTWVFVTKAIHPSYSGFMQVVWVNTNGEWSVDVLLNHMELPLQPIKGSLEVWGANLYKVMKDLPKAKG